jgi:hypothetical protein
MDNNEFHGTTKNAVLMTISLATVISNNKMWNCGHGGANDQDRTPFVVAGPDANSPPADHPTPRVFFRDNGFFFANVEGDILTDASSNNLLIGSDARLSWEITGTYGTPTSRKFSIAGTVQKQFRNHFRPNGYVNTAQNEPAYTAEFSNDFNLEAASTLSGVRDVLGTLLQTLRQKDIIG